MDPPVHLLEALASIEEQRRFIIGATVDHYLVPEEILNDASHFCWRMDRPEAYALLTDYQRQAIARLKESLARLGDCTELYYNGKIEDMIEQDICWSVMRDRAGEVFQAFGLAVPT